MPKNEVDPPAGTTRVTCHRCERSSIESLSGLVICRNCGEQVRPRFLNAKRFVLDSNAYDHLVTSPARQIAFIHACLHGQIELLVTHIQHDELSKIPDEERRNAIAAIPFVITPTAGLIIGTSKVGLARFGDLDRIESIRSEFGNHTNDALIAVTAYDNSAVLVTEERRLTNRSRAQDIEVWDANQLIKFVEKL